MELKLLEAELLKLSAKEKAAITHKLLSSLENENSEEIDKLWIAEAVNRYKEVTGNKCSLFGSEVLFNEAKTKYM